MLKDKIKQLLKGQRRTVADLSRHIGMSDTAIRKIYLRDSCELSTLRKIASFFEVPVTELLEESDLGNAKGGGNSVSIKNVERSFNVNHSVDEENQRLRVLVEELRQRIDFLTDKLLGVK